MFFMFSKITRKFEFFVDKGPGFGIFPDSDPDSGDPKRPDLTGSGSATLGIISVTRSKQALFLERRLKKPKKIFIPLIKTLKVQ